MHGQAGSQVADTPLRERKKTLTRQAILQAAQTLFEARGYDHVTVAEIADAANVSVKTLFVYFRSKDDLLFQDTTLIDTLLEALKSRPAAQTAADAVAAAMITMMKANGAVAESLEGFHRGYAGSDALRARLLRLWADYEDVLAQQLAHEAGRDAPNADIRFSAAQLVGLVRSTTWQELRDLARRDNGAVEIWLKQTATRLK